MVHRDKNFDSIPDSLKSKECKDNLKEIIEGIALELRKKPIDKEAIVKIKDKISEKYYRGSLLCEGTIIQDVVVALKVLYKNKCAYCESIEAEPQIEHYRTKKRVTGEANHYGYYWLAYEWTNLLPVCEKCNKAKGTQFPIMGTRVFEPSNPVATQSPLNEEQPYLLHPEIDMNFLDFFAFENNGEIKGIDIEKRGEKTKEICKLNRDTLIISRFKVIERFLQTIEYALYLCIGNESMFETSFVRIMSMLKERCNIDEPYSLLATYIYQNFETFFIPLLPYPTHKIVKQAFNQYISSKSNC